MDKLNQYRNIIKEFLLEQTKGNSLYEEIETEIIFDEDRDRYLLIDLGWDQTKRYYNCVFHLEIRNSKIWIQRNQTDLLITENLITQGVPKEDIILGMQPVYARQYTGFGVD